MEEWNNFSTGPDETQHSGYRCFLKKDRSSIRVALVVLSFLLIVTLGIATVIKQLQARFKNDKHEGLSSAAMHTETLEKSTFSDNSGRKVTDDSSIHSQAKALMEKADLIAQGYDYEKAINMLTGYEHYEKFPEMAQMVTNYQAEDAKLVVYQPMESITHIFFHSLIVDPSRAFDKDEDESGYNQYMTTCDEFCKILEEMYARGYVLVSPYDVAYEVEDPSGNYFVHNVIRLPKGKTPFLMSQDDVNYYSYMIGTGSGKNEIPVFADTNGDGFASKLILDGNGYPICEYVDKQGNITYGDFDLVPLLEKFIQEHPDFSYHGARAILGVTGYEGVFGYRTKPSYEKKLGSEAYQKECADAKAVAKCLRDRGWILASHSYGHPGYGNISASRVAADSDKWENTVQPIIGECDVILYPFGSDIAGPEHYTFHNAKFKALYEDGYRYFFNVDVATSWVQMGTNYYRGGRRNLDGYRMWYHPDRLKDLFQVDDVWDSARPTPVQPI